MDDILTIKQIEESLYATSGRIQELIKESKTDDDTKFLIDSIAQQQHYMFSYLIDYLKQLS